MMGYPQWHPHPRLHCHLVASMGLGWLRRKGAKLLRGSKAVGTEVAPEETELEEGNSSWAAEEPVAEGWEKKEEAADMREGWPKGPLPRNGILKQRVWVRELSLLVPLRRRQCTFKLIALMFWKNKLWNCGLGFKNWVEIYEDAVCDKHCSKCNLLSFNWTVAQNLWNVFKSWDLLS